MLDFFSVINNLAETIYLLARELRASRADRKTEFDWLRSHAGLATKQDLAEMEKRIMSRFTEHAEAQRAFNIAQEKAVDELVNSVAGVAGDVQALNDKIAELLATPGEWTPEEQALADEITEQGRALVAKTESVAAALKALDEKTAPPVPVPA